MTQSAKIGSILRHYTQLTDFGMLDDVVCSWFFAACSRRRLPLVWRVESRALLLQTHARADSTHGKPGFGERQQEEINVRQNGAVV